MAQVEHHEIPVVDRGIHCQRARPEYETCRPTAGDLTLMPIIRLLTRKSL